jgi:hypothetical protein
MSRNHPLASALLFINVITVSAIILPFAAIAQKPASTLTPDLPPGPMQAKATTSCVECHEARIILQQRLSKAAWTKEVDKMVKWGAVIDTTDHDALIDYLSTNFSPDQPPYTAPRTSAENASWKIEAGKSGTEKSAAGKIH